MPKDKFNPIDELPILTGAKIANDEEQSNIIDATYPPIEPLKENSLLPQLEMYRKEKKPEKAVIENSDRKKLFAIRTVIVVILITIILLGMFLTLNFVPRIADNVSNYSKSFYSIFVTTKNVTQIASTTPIKKSQPVNVVATPTPTPSPTSTPKTSVASPAKLIVGILSTDAIDNRVIIRFNVQNVGGTASGKWSFSVKLPSNSTPNYYSVVQNSIAPQNGIIYTLGFDADQDLPPQITLHTN